MFVNCRNSSVLQEIGVEERVVTSDFRPEVEIKQLRAYALKIKHAI